eukprot:jgi/Botrbrau1/5072/Bobra.37_1s0036.1
MLERNGAQPRKCSECLGRSNIPQIFHKCRWGRSNKSSHSQQKGKQTQCKRGEEKRGGEQSKAKRRGEGGGGGKRTKIIDESDRLGKGTENNGDVGEGEGPLKKGEGRVVRFNDSSLSFARRSRGDQAGTMDKGRGRTSL